MYTMYLVKNYVNRLTECLDSEAEEKVYKAAKKIYECGKENGCLYICGNGGSAANAMHIANDLHYGAYSNKSENTGLKVEALTSNTSIVTCLGNDLGYENIFSHQIERKGNKGDILLVLSGSGNSDNIIKALESGKKKEMTSIAILGYDGGKCKDMANITVHFKIKDMQILEDLQLIFGHICMKFIINESQQYEK